MDVDFEDDDQGKIRRTMDQVNKIADIAGLSRRKGMVQTLNFAEELGSSEFKLLEVPNDVFGALKEGESVVIRGDRNDEAVLCTETATYEMKAADTSNLLILLPGLKTPKSTDFDSEQSMHDVEIVESLFSYYELKKIRPKLQKLKFLLEETKYTGPENEEQHYGKMLTLEDLKDLVQASDEELRTGLVNIGAFETKGYWRLLDISYKEKVFAQILKLLDEESWNYWEIPLKTTCDILEELFPREIIEHCLSLYGEKQTNETTRVTFSLNEDKVCKFFAECILRGADKFNHHEFFEAWRQSVPDGMTTKNEQLQGLALEDTTSHPPVIWHFPASNLPEDPSERFNTLFKVRSKWTRQEIEPYIAELCGPKESMNALLLKYARCSTDALGNKVYNSKRPIQ